MTTSFVYTFVTDGELYSMDGGAARMPGSRAEFKLLGWAWRVNKTPAPEHTNFVTQITELKTQGGNDDDKVGM